MGWADPSIDREPVIYSGLQHGPRDGWRSDFSTRVVSAHNVSFEYAIYNLILHRRYGWPARWDPALWSCTMARAAMVGLPLKLEHLCQRLGTTTLKDLEGQRIMNQLCKPIGHDAIGDAIFDNDPAKLQRLYQYNAIDVKVEMEVDALLPELPPSEKDIWMLDLVMNRRGIQIDLNLAAKASAASKAIMGDLNSRLREITGGAVDKNTQVAALKRYLASLGVEIPTKYVDGEEKETLGRVALIELAARNGLPPKAREVIEVRQQASKSTSTAKYAKALQMACADGRVRGNLQYHGAHTGRWSGRLLQAHNFPKGFDENVNPGLQASVISTVLDNEPGAFSLKHGVKAMSVLSDALRGMIVAAPGKSLVSADFNAIEARVIFWLAGDEGALSTYRRGDSPYLDMANYIYNRKDITKKGSPKEYDIGKRTILGCGFGMGWPKFKASVYEETAKATGVPVLLDDTLAERAVKAYREKHSAVVRLWAELDAAANLAVQNPGRVYLSCGGRVLWGMNKDRRFLVAKLPSGRFLWYYKPSIRQGKTPWGAPKDEMVYWGEHPKTGQWEQIKTYGGMLAENVTQAVARDVMANGMLQAEAAGYPMILTVHDELLAEVPTAELGSGAKSLKDFMRIMCDTPAWAVGLPVLAEGWVGQRYRK